ncbi:MAG: hypothetical protein RMJ15_05040, partial [Nitrososphaerota archaeon]|nr:hypothetical protein [Nitrososphaerota archaeon]
MDKKKLVLLIIISVASFLAAFSAGYLFIQSLPGKPKTSSTVVVQVLSDTSWTGCIMYAVAGKSQSATFEGSGNRNFQIGECQMVSVSFQKQSV